MNECLGSAVSDFIPAIFVWFCAGHESFECECSTKQTTRRMVVTCVSVVMWLNEIRNLHNGDGFETFWASKRCLVPTSVAAAAGFPSNTNSLGQKCDAQAAITKVFCYLDFEWQVWEQMRTVYLDEKIQVQLRHRALTRLTTILCIDCFTPGQCTLPREIGRQKFMVPRRSTRRQATIGDRCTGRHVRLFASKKPERRCARFRRLQTKNLWVHMENAEKWSWFCMCAGFCCWRCLQVRSFWCTACFGAHEFARCSCTWNPASVLTLDGSTEVWRSVIIGATFILPCGMCQTHTLRWKPIKIFLTCSVILLQWTAREGMILMSTSRLACPVLYKFSFFLLVLTCWQSNVVNCLQFYMEEPPRCLHFDSSFEMTPEMNVFECSHPANVAPSCNNIITSTSTNKHQREIVKKFFKNRIRGRSTKSGSSLILSMFLPFAHTIRKKRH